jgi:FtsH-binding integral membrane protein
MENNIHLPEGSYHTEKVSYLKESKVQGISKSFIANVFMWMFGGLLITALIAVWFASNKETLMSALVSVSPSGKPSMSMLGFLVMFAPLGFVLIMSFGYQRLSATAMSVLYVLYAAINGISFSFILLAYTASSVAGCFFSAAAMFGVMAVMGYTTKKDLTGFGSIMIMGLVGILIAMVINFFLHSSGLDYLISFVGVLVFTGLTAYDVQKLKNIGAGADMQDASAQKLAVFGALNLYLDFINLFLMLLRLFGSRRN